MVRETGALTLSDALRRCSLLPAQFLEKASPAMTRKGRVQVGADADLIVFDAGQVSDRSTYDAPQASSTGVEHVLVAGRVQLSATAPWSPRRCPAVPSSGSPMSAETATRWSVSTTSAPPPIGSPVSYCVLR